MAIKTKNGVRYYGCWAGDPNGTKEDVSRCIAQVYSRGRGMSFYQCNRKRGHGPDGLYCKQHGTHELQRRGRQLKDSWD